MEFAGEHTDRKDGIALLIPLLAAAACLLTIGVSSAFSVHFAKVGEIDHPLTGALPCGDANHNGLNEIYTSHSPGSETLAVLEHQGDNQYREYVLSVLALGAAAVGDCDGDSLPELYAQWIVDSTGNYCERVVESLDRQSFPSRRVLDIERDGSYRYPQYLDLDRDRRTELVLRFWSEGIRLFECAGNDSYYLAAALQSTPPSSFARFCAGDFDRDGLMELVAGCGMQWVHVFEATGNDNEYVYNGSVETPADMNYAMCAPGDMDHDSWPEFVVFGDSYGGRMMVFEASGNNQYRMIYSEFVSFGGGNPACAADVDGDGENELVVSSNRCVVFKSDGPDHYTRIWQSSGGGNGSTAVYDLNNNGRAEIVIGTGSYADIWEDTTGLTGVTQFDRLRQLSPVTIPTIARLGSRLHLSDLPDQADVSVFDAQGRQLVDELKLSGSAWSWDLRTREGVPVPPGAYFAVVNSTGRRTTHKFCVVR